MLDAADVLVDRQVAVDFLARERQFPVMRVSVTQVVPARASERVHRVRLATCGLAAFGARALDELGVLGERLPRREVDVLGQSDW